MCRAVSGQVQEVKRACLLGTSLKPLLELRETWRTRNVKPEHKAADDHKFYVELIFDAAYYARRLPRSVREARGSHTVPPLGTRPYSHPAPSMSTDHSTSRVCFSTGGGGLLPQGRQVR